MFLSNKGVEIGKATSSYANNNTYNVSHSSASVNECSSDESIDINRDLFAAKKQKFNQMHAANGTVAPDNVNVWHSETPDLVSQDSAENRVKTTQSLGMVINATATGAELAKDDDELKISRRRQNNKESARRSRLRKLEAVKKLRAVVEELEAESYALKDELFSHYKECAKLKNENEFLMKELKRIYDPNAISYIAGSMPVLVKGKSIGTGENSRLLLNRGSSQYYNLNVKATSNKYLRQQGPW